MNSKGLLIAGQDFTKYIDIDTEVSPWYAATVEVSILVGDLKSDAIEVTGPKARST